MLLRDLNSRYQGVETLVSIPLGSNKRLIGVNGARWSISFSLATGAGGSFKVSNENQTLGKGWSIPAAGLALTFTARDFPGYVGGEFWAVSSTAGVQVTVTEVFEIASLSEEGLTDVYGRHSDDAENGPG